MRYTDRSIRAADLFSLILMVFGIGVVILGWFWFVNDGNAVRAIGIAACGLVLSSCGVTLLLKVRQLRRTDGIEPGVVPDSPVLPVNPQH